MIETQEREDTTNRGGEPENNATMSINHRTRGVWSLLEIYKGPSCTSWGKRKTMPHLFSTQPQQYAPKYQVV